MKGPRVAGQHADSAAGYCPSKTLSYSENIMIHLHIFSSRPYSHSHRHKPVGTQKYTHTHIHTFPHQKHTSRVSKNPREESWRAVRHARMLVGAQSNKNAICTSSTAHQPQGEAYWSIWRLIRNGLTRGDFLPSSSQPFLLGTMRLKAFCHQKTKRQLFLTKCPIPLGGNKKGLSQWVWNSLKCTG